MSSSKSSTVGMSTMAILLLLMVLAEGRGMDDCGRNRTCRKLSRECKKLLFTSMVDNYVGAGDDEIVSTVDKMAAMMKMFMEQKNNLTDCANETGIQLPNSGEVHMDAGVATTRLQCSLRTHTRSGTDNTIKKVIANPGRDSCDTGLKKVIAIPGSGGVLCEDRRHRRQPGYKRQHGNFGASKEDGIELRKCLLNKKLMLNPDGSLNRESLKAQISSSYSFQAGLQAAVQEAVDTCPEPQDYNIAELNKCIHKACIDNLQLDTDDFSQNTIRPRIIRCWPDDE